MPQEISRISDFFSFLDFFSPSFAAIGLKLSVLLCNKEFTYCSSYRLGLIDSFLQELCTWKFAEFQIFLVFRTFLAHLSWKLKWAYLIAFCPSSVCPSDVCLLDFCIFNFFFRTAWPILTKVGTNHP
jgi:hypothetical protein